MVISDTMEGAKQGLRNWWNDNYEEEFEDLDLDITLNPFPSPIKETYRKLTNND